MITGVSRPQLAKSKKGARFMKYKNQKKEKENFKTLALTLSDVSYFTRKIADVCTQAF